MKYYVAPVQQSENVLLTDWIRSTGADQILDALADSVDAAVFAGRRDPKGVRGHHRAAPLLG